MGLIVSLIIGAIAGWLAGRIVRGRGQGVFMNIVIGMVGGAIASFLASAAGMHIAGEDTLLDAIVYSTAGATLLLILLRMVGGK